jgi:hypothetical protein
MARAKKATAKVEELRPYVEGVAKNLVDKLYGPAGLPWGVTLTELEDLCLGIRVILTEKLMDVARLVQTRAGEAEWLEPQAYCRSCRQAFFPSVQEPGPGSQPLQPRPPK